MNKYCVLPFNSISIGTEGKIRPCCNSTGLTPYAKIQDLTLDTALNSRPIREIRKSFIKGIDHSACDRCWKMEERGQESFRESANRNEFYGVHTGTPRTKSIGYDNIRYIDITLGNK